jgi:hypothetical protein
LKLNGTHQLLVYADDINILGRSAHTIEKNTEALVVASKEIGKASEGLQSKLRTEELQILCITEQNIVAVVIWYLGLVHP